jgi:hypothetical protein
MDDLHVARGRLARRSSQFQASGRKLGFFRNLRFSTRREDAILAGHPLQGPPGPAYFVAM